MSESDDWFIGEDGSLNIGEPTIRVTYHSSLNTLLVATKDSKLRVIDVTSGSVLQNSDLSAPKTTEGIQCVYLPSQDKLLFSSGYAVSVRKDLNGVMLLDTALQTPVRSTDDIVKVELPLPEASQLFKSLMGAELAGVDHVEDVLREVENEIETAQQATKHNHKVAKWATVCFKLPYFTLKSVCSSLVAELKRLHQNNLGLSVASTISDRLLYLIPSSHDSAQAAIDRSLMYSESARRETFAKWPHMNYKWALPDPMAKAGFYHQPNSTGDDRAMCFTCNVCLVCWEPTDEPWSEHERHSSGCPFVKGEHTQNVPLSVTYATEPAKPHGDKSDKIACISTLANCDMFATSTLHGHVVIWDCARVLKKHIQFHIDPMEPLCPFHLRTTAAKCADPADSSSQESSTSESSQESVMEVQTWTSPGKASDQPDHKHDDDVVTENSTNTEPSGEGPSTEGKETDLGKSTDPQQSQSSTEQTSATTNHDDSSSSESTSKPTVTGNSESSNTTHNSELTSKPLVTNHSESSDCIQFLQPVEESEVHCSNLNSSLGPCSSTDEQGHAEVIEVKGAWVKPNAVTGLVTEIPLNEDHVSAIDYVERHRPSHDVVVSALSVVGPYRTSETAKPPDVTVQASLISGVLIRVDNMGLNSAAPGNTPFSDRNEVQALNEVNQAISEETKPAIITDEAESRNEDESAVISGSSSQSGSRSGSQSGVDNFMPYLLVHYLGCGSRNEVQAPAPTDGSTKSCVIDTSNPGDKSSYMEVYVKGVVKAYKPSPAYTAASPASPGAVVPEPVSPQESQENVSVSGSNVSISRSTHMSQPDGAVIQCLPLVSEVGPDHYVHSITPSGDGRYVIVVTAPKALNGKLTATHGGENSVSQTSHGGCVLIYKVKQDMECITLDETPCRMSVIDDVGDAMISLTLLPQELGGATGNLRDPNAETIQGSVVVTTHEGQVKVITLDNLKVVGTISPPEGEQFISATFCTGIDRLCCCSDDGKLYFYMVGPRGLHLEDLALGLEPAGGGMPKVGTQISTEDTPDCGNINTEITSKTESLLVHQPLTPEVLQGLHSLTQFENLMPRFCATVPPCWNEIQQEQQQRRHPQHLQHQGDSTQHTHTWRLYPDSTSWDEHLFELVIPKTCCVGHIDVKFSLFPLCTSVPHIQVTLLRQSMAKLGRSHGGPESAADDPDLPATPTGRDVDAKIDFNLREPPRSSSNPTDEDKVDQSEEPIAGGSGANPRPAPVINPVLTKVFLDRHGAEVLCGPVDVPDCVDMSGLGGVITLTGPELLKIKSRSFLLHIKAMINPGQGQDRAAKKPNPPKSKQEDKEKPVRILKTKSTKKHKDGSLSALSSQDRLTALTSKQKQDRLKGCDWLQELSITVRRCQPVNIPRERLERVTMLEDQGLHERLLKLVCMEDDGGVFPACNGVDGAENCVGLERRRILALDILSWICSILMYANDRSRDQAAIVLTTETFLPSLVQSCFVEANRSIAHQCTKYLTVLIEFSKSVDNPSLSTDFVSSLLSSMLGAISSIAAARSAGSLHWFFVLLNRVKCMDVNLAGSKCVEMMSMVAGVYNERNNPLHALLKSRFGLYGHPLDPELFDIEPPGFAKIISPTAPNYSTYAGVVTNNNNNNNNGMPTAGSIGPQFDEPDIKDYLLLTAGDKNAPTNGKNLPEQLSSHVFGLLEVEPLHFTCHAASDGTRVERIDTGPVGPTSGTNAGVSGLSGTINFGAESTMSASASAMSSLSAATEHQLSILNQKHLQLLKLQQQKQKLEQKLAESSSKASSVGTAAYSNPELYPPTPKNTPFFMTPPVTPPNEGYHNIYIGGGGMAGADIGKPTINKEKSGDPKPNQLKSSFFWSQTQHLFQPMPPQALVIERLHSGARRFVVLDFGKPILLTDAVVPGCSDLQSLSIDVWTLGEDVDGHRLVVANDIGLRSLILNDLSPPPLCRYMKITTIGRHGGNAARSKIPLGSFYGHSFLLPRQNSTVTHPLAPPTATTPPNEQSGSSSQSDDETHVMSQLGLCMSLHEDIQCRYSLACNRLVSLLNMVQVPHSSVDHTLYYLKQGKKVEDDRRITQSYQDCMSLQLQLNLAQWAIDRLQGALGIRPPIPTGCNTMVLLRQASTDKLRVLSEFLLDTLLSMTCPRPTIPQLPSVLCSAFTPQMCENLFRNLCVTGTKKTQIHAGMLLVRLCGNQPWWGEFLGNTLQEYLTCEQSLVFPRDRVFLVLSALSQKALGGSSANHVLESLISLLGRLLAPLLTQNTNTGYRSVPPVVDQSLVSWMLLFLSRSLDSTPVGWLSDDGSDKGAVGGASRDKDVGSSNRWDFLQGESSLQKRGGATRSRKSYHNRQRGRFWHSKHQLHMQQLKKEYITEHANKALSNVYTSNKPEAYKLEVLNKTHAMIKKQYKQYSSKHFKDLLNIRRTTGEFLRKRDKEEACQNGDLDPGDGDSDVQFVLSREKCFPVVKGLVSLLLSTDFTCHVDLFIVACKVLARITSLTRPVMVLSEIMSQSDLDELVLLTCGAQYNHGNMSWGGSWAGHTISCLLQDILDGERMYGLCTEGVTEEDVSASVVTETDTSLQNSTTLPTIDEDNNTTATTAPDPSQVIDLTGTDGEGKLLPDDLHLQQDVVELSMLLQEQEEAMMDVQAAAAAQPKYGQMDAPVPKYGGVSQMLAAATKLHNKSDQSVVIAIDPKVPPGSMSSIISQHMPGLLSGDKIQLLKMSKGKLAQQYSSLKAAPVPQGVSTAMDARLELGVQLATELKLKVMLSADTESVQNALTMPLPPLPGGATHSMSLSQSYQPTDDEQLSEVSAYSLGQQQLQVAPSVEMLSTCFNALFCHRVNLDTLLLLWLTLNEDGSQEESALCTFDSSRVPTIPLSETAISSLLESLVHSPFIPVRTWVLTFQCLTLSANLKYTPQGDTAAAASSVGPEKWLAQAMLADPNLINIFLKFLSWTGCQGLVISSQQHSQVGPTAVKAFHEVLVRLQLRCAEENECLFRELLLRLVYQLSTDRGAFSLGIGPLDAQCRLLDHMLEQSYEKQVDINNAISVIESVSLLVHQHIISHERVGCRSSTESGVGARSCFGGLFASVLRAGNSRSMTGDANRDLLMSNLLSLVNLLVEAPVPNRAPRRRTTIASVGSINEVFERDVPGGATNSPMTDLSKINHSLAGLGGRLNGAIMTSTPNFPLSDEEKGAETDEQKTEHAAPAPKPPNIVPDQRKSCSHFWDSMNPDSEVKEPLLADFVLQHQHIMFHFLQALGYCHSNAIATIIGSNGNINDTFLNLDPVSVGDGIFQIMCTLNRRATELPLIMRPLYQYLSSQVPSFMPQGVCQLSEPLLWLILSVLDCETAIKTFMDMGGIEVVCENLVRSTHSVISTSPGLVSTIMQYLGIAKGRSSMLPRKYFPTELDNNETLQNFAPIGTITSSSPSAGPADVLIQAVAPHRRARSAAWSFNFYPHEAWVDLIITLPCAVLLREVHIQPHLTSLATCPSAVTLEVSRDGLTQIPVTSPLITSGLNTIKVILHRPEVITMATIRLHKPRDSTAVGLSQIRLLGSMAFGDTGPGKGGSSNGVGEDYVARTSMGWLRMLHHCLTHCETIQSQVAMASTPVQPLLRTCTSLLLSSGANLYVTNIEAVLLTLGLHSADMSLGLIDHLLRNTPTFDEQGVCLGRSTAVANESTVDLIYQLGIHQDQATMVRVKAMIEWLGDSARVALQRAHGAGNAESFHRYGVSIDLPSPAPAHIHCVAAVLWHSQDKRVAYNLSNIITTELLSSMYEWSMVLPATSTLKQAVDTVICSFCYIRPEYFTTLLEWIGVIVGVDLSRASVTDDHKDSHGGGARHVAMTDDLNVAMTDDLKEAAHIKDDTPILLREFGDMMLDECHLSTLAMACQSPISLRQLVGSNFLAVLGQGLYEFCVTEMSRGGEPVIVAEMFTGRGRSSSGPTSPRSGSIPRGLNGNARRHSSDSLPQDKRMTITADLVAPVLRFLAEISKEVVVKDWLGDVEGCVFWPVLLRLLCSAPITLTRTDASQTGRSRTMTVQQRSAIESATIDFFSSVLSCHHGNQIQFANILCDVIRGQGSTVDEYGYRSSPLCGFMRCLFLQVLLEEEKVCVCLKASSQLYKGLSNALTALVQHPRFGAGHKFRVVQVSLQSTCSEIMAKVSGKILKVAIQAWGYEDRYPKGYIKIDGKTVDDLKARGLHIVALTPNSDSPDGYDLTKENFDVWGNEANARLLSEHIEKLPCGTYILGASADEVSTNLSPGRPALRLIGVRSSQLKDRGSLAFIAKKGFPNYAVQKISPKREGPTLMTGQINLSADELDTDTPSLANQTAQLLEEKGEKALGEDWVMEGHDLGMDAMVEQMAAAAGMHAKEKRDKSSVKSPSPSRPPSRRGNRPGEALSNMQIPVLMLHHRLMPGQPIPGDLTLSQLLVLLKERGLPEGQSTMDFFMKFKTKNLTGIMSDTQNDTDWGDATDQTLEVEPIPEAILLETPMIPTALQVFASVGGLALLAEHLPLLYPEVSRQGISMDGVKDLGSGVGPDWGTVENTEDIYEEIYEPIPSTQGPTVSKQSMPASPSIPPHSLVAFGLFLRLPGYAEVLLKEKRKAQCLLRLVLGVTDDGEGGHILTSPIASYLATLPFNVLKLLFDSTPLSTDDGVLLRRMTLEIGAIHLVLACLSVLSHHTPRQNIPGIHQEIILAATQAASAIGTSTTVAPPKPTTDERSQQYWAKGTGFGTGSTASYWDAEQALIRQKCEEEHVTCLLHVLASFINPGAALSIENMADEDATVPLPVSLPDLFTQSCMVPALCSYLRNDSVLDMARHVPLYRAVLELLRGVAVCSMLVPLLLPLGGDEDTTVSISSLLDKMKICVDTYASRLKTNKKGKAQREDEESEGLALLIPDIQTTAKVVDTVVHKIREKTAAESNQNEDDVDIGQQGASKSDYSMEERYLAVMRELQFDTSEIVLEDEGKLEFTMPHHYESNVKASGDINNAARARRLAQEAVTLSTSLPLSASSSVFVRCDEERLDVMKVLITGPGDTPYGNGCFEFDVYFPQDYPNTPPQINLETTGNHTVRFNPNLYNDGKVCLSILNTWHGRPEEKWNAQTSSFLQVLVSIQSLILVSEPYFNEPGYERSRGTASGTSCSKEYDANIRQASVKWGMLEMLRNPSPCFKEVVECHFWMKRHEIIRQVEDWITDLEANCNDKRVGRTITHSCVALKRHFNQLKEEFAKMKPPESIPGSEDDPVPEECQNGCRDNSAGTSAQATTNGHPVNTNDKKTQSAVGGQTDESLMLSSSSGQALMSALDFIEIPEQDFTGFSSDTDSDMDLCSNPGPSEIIVAVLPETHMNSISPLGPDALQNSVSEEVPKNLDGNLYYL